MTKQLFLLLAVTCVSLPNNTVQCITDDGRTVICTTFAGITSCK